MNVITYAHAISLYPRATFIDRVAFRSASWSEADVVQRAQVTTARMAMLTRARTRSNVLNSVIGALVIVSQWVIPLRF